MHVKMSGVDAVMLPPKYFDEELDLTENDKKRRNDFRKDFGYFDAQLSMRFPNGRGGFLCSNEEKANPEIHAIAMSNFTITSRETNQNTKGLPLIWYLPEEIEKWSLTSKDIFKGCELIKIFNSFFNSF